MEKNNKSGNRNILVIKKVLFVILTIRLKRIYIREVIREQTKYAIQQIFSSFQEFLLTNKEKQVIVFKKIIKERNYFALLLQDKLRTLKYQNEVRNLIKKKSEYFFILFRIKNVKCVSLDVFLRDNTVKRFDFEYCKILDSFILYIPKIQASGQVFRVHFICDGKIVIDPMYRTCEDERGNFYNLIDFVKIEANERSLAEDKERVVKYFISMIKRERDLKAAYFRITGEEGETVKSSSDDDMDEISKENVDGELGLPTKFLKKGNRTNSYRKSFNFGSSFGNRSLLSLTNIMGRNKTFMNLLSPKSILRTPNSSRGNLCKKVSFSNEVKFTN